MENTIQKSLNKKGEENENNNNNNVRDKNDFYSLDVNNSSGRQVNENEG